MIGDRVRLILIPFALLGAACVKPVASLPGISSTVSVQELSGDRKFRLEETRGGGDLGLSFELEQGERPYTPYENVPSGDVHARSRVEPDGEWTEHEIRAISGVATIDIPALYPEGSTLRVRVESPKGVAEALVRNPPKTKRVVGLDGHEASKVHLGDARLDAVAYRPLPRKEDDAPTVGVLVSATLPTTENVMWRLGEIEIKKPFAPVDPEGASSSKVMRFVFNPRRLQYLEEIVAPFADQFPKVGVVGTLERLEYREDLVGFGQVPLERRRAQTMVVPRRDIRRPLGDGRTVVLKAWKPNGHYGGADRSTTMNMSLEGGPAGQQEWVYIYFPKEDEAYGTLEPGSSTGEVTLYHPVPKGPFRLRIRTARVVETTSFDLNPTVQRVAFRALASDRFGRLSYMGIPDDERLKLLPKP